MPEAVDLPARIDEHEDDTEHQGDHRQTQQLCCQCEEPLLSEPDLPPTFA